MDQYIDSMMNTPEGQAMYDEMMFMDHDLEDTTELSGVAYSYVYHYYAHEFYQLFMPDPCDLEPDSNAMCYNGNFTESSVSDDHLKGFRLFGGRFFDNIPGCTHDCSALMNLPLPENSYPADALWPFNLNPNDNNPGTGPYDIQLFTFHRVEMMLPNAGIDPYVPSITKNPPTGNRSIRLNRDLRYAHTNTMERTFRVKEEDRIYRFSFALVLEDPNHPIEIQPYFMAVALDENGNTIEELCFKSDPNDPRMEGGKINGVQLTYRNWDCAEFDLTAHVGKDVTVRFVAAGCAWSGHWGYAYVADICETECAKIKIDEEQYICPDEFPLEFCGEICVDTSIYTIDSVFMQIRQGTAVIATIPYTSYDMETMRVCFEVSEQLYNSLPAGGYDVYIMATITHIQNNFTSTISSPSSFPNTVDEQNNDIIKTCCPEVELEPAAYDCVDETLKFCGQVRLDSCIIESIRLIVTSSMGIEATIPVEVDSAGNFCVIIEESIKEGFPEECLSVLVYLTMKDTSTNEIYTVVYGPFHEEVEGADCSIDFNCCPEDADPFNISTSKFLCLVGTGYTNLVFDVVGRIPLSSFPEGFTYCDIPITFNGGHLDYNLIYTDSWFLHFSGLLHVTDTTQLLIHQPSGNYYMTGTLILCNENDLECEFDVELHFGMGQGSMCTEMEGIMCNNFLPDTSPYNPSGSAPPPNDGTNVYLPIKISVPYIGKIDDRDTCWIDQYWFEVYGADPSIGGGTDLLHNSSISQQGSEFSGLFAQFIVIDVDDWNSYSYIYVKFWNNCGDTCQLKNINVIPVIRGGMLIADDFNRLDEVKNVTVYPNPVRNELIVDYSNLREEAEIRMFDRSGRIVNSSRISGHSGRTIIPVNELLSGIYLIEITDSGLEKRVFVIMKE